MGFHWIGRREGLWCGWGVGVVVEVGVVVWVWVGVGGCGRGSSSDRPADVTGQTQGFCCVLRVLTADGRRVTLPTALLDFNLTLYH